MKIISCILFALCTVIYLSGCSMFQTISLLKGGETHVRANQESVIPFELSGNLILMTGRINNSSRNYAFMLDTGALTVIGKDVANELGLAEEVAIEMKDGAEGKEDVYLTRLKSLTIGGFKVDDISAAVFDLSRIRRLSGIQIDGIIGSNFLHFFKVKINYQKRLVTLSGDTAPLKSVPGASPLKIEQLMTMGFAPQVTVSCGDDTFDALIDTGLKYPLALPPALMKKLHRGMVVEGKGVMGGGAFKDNENPRLIRLNGLRIGSSEMGKVVATTTEGQNNALIGYPLLSHYVVILNYPAGEMLLIPTEGGKNVGNVFTAGMTVRRDDTGKTQVSGVWNGSPVDRRGVALGDEIVSVNGRSAGDFTLQELRDQLHDDDSIKTVQLLVKNPAGENSLTIQKEDLFPDADRVTQKDD